ncbi:MAG: L-sorbosone dehydrogenase [Bacteroidetes bacterium]|nr:L-sorbosone dehydrogenase [Bacteroidota bacterium]
MNKIDTIFYFSLVFSFSGFSQPGTAKLTSEKKVPSQIVEISIPSKFKGSKLEKKTLNVPKGYKVSLFHTGQLSKCRFMDWGPDSVLYVANMNSGDILALPDRNHDLVADTCMVAARGAYGHCVTFFEDAMYVAEEKKVLRLTETDKECNYETRSIFIDSILRGKKRTPVGHTKNVGSFMPMISPGRTAEFMPGAHGTALE